MRKHTLTFFFLLFFSGFSQAQIADLAKAEAMFVYNFSRLIQWPESHRTGNFLIGVLGTTNVYSELVQYCNSKKVGFQEIQVVRYRNVEEIDNCHVLFVANNRSNLINEVVTKVGSSPTLIISEKEGLIDNVAINFIIADNKLQFELNEQKATSNGLKISARLKDMAAKVL